MCSGRLEHLSIRTARHRDALDEWDRPWRLHGPSDVWASTGARPGMVLRHENLTSQRGQNFLGCFHLHIGVFCSQTAFSSTTLSRMFHSSRHGFYAFLTLQEAKSFNSHICGVLIEASVKDLAFKRYLVASSGGIVYRNEYQHMRSNYMFGVLRRQENTVTHQRGNYIFE